MFEFEVLAAGDSAILVQLEQRVDPELNGWCIELARVIETRLGPSVLDVVVGYCSVTTYFNPLAVDAKWLEEEVRICAAGITNVRRDRGGLVDIPVCYGGEFGPDLSDVARFGGCTEEEVVAIHSAGTYRVYLVGFVPGFAYLASVDPQIAAPRRPAPRTAVPSGSVAIAGEQTGVYPSSTPGGWNIIGRTPVKPYDPSRREPFLFKPGDRVRFRRITAPEFAAHSA
jgi:inhibitor of KinA